MTSPWRRAVAAAAVATAALAAVPGRSWGVNDPVVVKPEHPARTLLTGGLVFLDSWRPLTPQLGGFFQIAVFPTKVTAGPAGSQEIEAPHLYLHAGAAAGYRFTQPDPRLYGLGAVGPLWRTAGEGPSALGWLTELGVLAGVVWPQRQIGPLVRIEIMDNIGIQGGPLFGWSGRETGAVVGIDYMRDLFHDLGITK
jgi:hypothetical protein